MHPVLSKTHVWQRQKLHCYQKRVHFGHKPICALFLFAQDYLACNNLEWAHAMLVLVNFFKFSASNNLSTPCFVLCPFLANHTTFSLIFPNHVVAFCCFCWQRTLVCRVVLCCANKLLQTCFGVYNPILFVKNKCRCKSHFATTFCGVCFQQLCVFAFVNFVVFVALPLQLCTTWAICRQTGKKV